MTSRRRVLAGLVAAVGAFGSGPAWSAAPTMRQTELFAAWHQARRLGAPLLVVVVSPDDPWQRGSAVGGALTEAEGPLLARLSGYVPACATLEDLALLGVEVPERTWFVIVEGGVPPRVTLIPDLTGVGHPIDLVRHTLLMRLPERPAVLDARRTWSEDRLPGSFWALETGCGWVLAGTEEDGYGVLCGMGSIPERGARFLAFFPTELDE